MFACYGHWHGEEIIKPLIDGIRRKSGDFINAKIFIMKLNVDNFVSKLKGKMFIKKNKNEILKYLSWKNNDFDIFDINGFSYDDANKATHNL